MTPGDASPPVDWHQRANEAARSVAALFGRRLFFLPGTHLGEIQWPALGWREDLKGKLLQPWHYWWQAHYVDCLVDAGRRELGNGATPAARFNGPERPSAGRLASRLVTGIRLRNALTFVNNYYDDMAWLALATLRLDALAGETRRPGRRRNEAVRKTLTLQFDAACTDDLGGGSFWSKKRDFKNTPATAPVALFYARTGQRAKAQSLLDWLDATLFDREQGLYLDGARLGPDRTVVIERSVYTYNQGPVLGALLELGGDANLARAAVLVDAVDRHLTVPAVKNNATNPRLVLRCEGTGDGGLFTGILCRYLALAATDRRLPEGTRATAARLVTGTADAFWTGRRPAGRSTGRGRKEEAGRFIFPMHAADRGEMPSQAGAAVELSTQLQAWMAIEAAATISLLDYGTQQFRNRCDAGHLKRFPAFVLGLPTLQFLRWGPLPQGSQGPRSTPNLSQKAAPSMKIRNSALAGIALAATAALGLTACAGSGTPASTGSAAASASTGAVSGEITVYNAQHESLTKEWIDAFTAETGVKVTMRQGSDTELSNQIIQEGAASPADVFLTENSPAMTQVENADLFADVDKATTEQVPEEFRPSTGKWTGIAARSTVLVYDKAKLTEDQLPKSMLDLAKPEWKGKWAASPSGADFQAIVSALLELKGEAATEEWLAGMKENFKAYKGNSTAMKAVNAGEVDAALIYHYYYYGDQAKTGENSKNVTPYYFKNQDPGAFVSISGGGVLKTSKNAAAAQAFLKFITGKKGQEVLQNGTSFEYAIASDVPANEKLVPIADLQAPTVDPAKLNSEKVTDLMTKAGLL